MKPSFLKSEKAIITSMVQGETPDRIKYLMDKSLAQGAEAYGMQFCRLLPEYRNREVYRDLFSYAKDKPVYVTNYRVAKNEGKRDDTLAEELLELADCGATLCDVIGDCFDKQPDELAINPDAIEKQKNLIEKLHEKGAEVLMSSHIPHEITPAERVLEIALAHEARGADISKIVTMADTMEQQIENLRIINLLKQNLKIPFLFLCGGECSILRRIGGEIGSCMYLGVAEYDDLATPMQPIVEKLRAIRDNM